ncbi:hypothetical protein BP6252_11254 [Coleophoma cylindrospora]|uniref:AB hydrolase-1 domain-containing protein n=1 Tax=Coleophoma cylindrospora TaxID=1849047 RepID=A0A3D8QPI0_9HELO|nr:hypothetical protein BP6252_11254 [Coleophoma cylindrospora]
MAQQLNLPDGRNLDYLVSGAKDGFPLVWIHGTPGAYMPPPSLVTACEKKGIMVISFSRAGYGGSTRKQGRQIVDYVADTQALIDHLGVERCLVGGWSGGGMFPCPHALVSAARLRGCVAALCVAGVALYDAEGLDFLAGQGEDNIVEFNAALRGIDELQKFCAISRTEMLKGDVAGMVEAMSSLLPDVDKDALMNGNGMGEYLHGTINEGLKISANGWVDDTMSSLKPWGFELSEIKVPVIVYQGSEDKMVPYAHGEWLVNHLPQEKLSKHLMQGQGHVSIFIGQEDTMLDELLDVAKL